MEKKEDDDEENGLVVVLEKEVMEEESLGGPYTRGVGGTEYCWCKAVGGGTGITVLALRFDTHKLPVSLLEPALRAVQAAHPRLRSRLLWTRARPSLSVAKHPYLKLQLIHHTSPPPTSLHTSLDTSLHTNLDTNLDDSIATSVDTSVDDSIVTTNLSSSDSSSSESSSESSWMSIVESELSMECPEWREKHECLAPQPMMFASLYSNANDASKDLKNDENGCATDGPARAAESLLVLRLHTAICDRTSAATILTSFIQVMLNLRGRRRRRASQPDSSSSVPNGTRLMDTNGSAEEPSPCKFSSTTSRSMGIESNTNHVNGFDDASNTNHVNGFDDASNTNHVNGFDDASNTNHALNSFDDASHTNHALNSFDDASHTNNALNSFDGASHTNHVNSFDDASHTNHVNSFDDASHTNHVNSFDASCHVKPDILLSSQSQEELDGDGDNAVVVVKLDPHVVDYDLAAIEDCISKEMCSKPFWAHGIDILGYSLGSRRHAMLPFQHQISTNNTNPDTTPNPNAEETSCSRIIRQNLNAEQAGRLLQECGDQKVRLSGALTAAGLKATAMVKKLGLGFRGEHHGVVTLLECRSLLQPPMASSTVGFYHSAVMNTYYIQGEDMDFWELARKCSSTLEEAIKRRKHFTDMGDVGLLMCQAIQRPHLTPFSSLRTSTLVVFDNEEYVQNVQDQKKDEQLRDDFDELGLLEYVGCSSIHGVGPSIAIFDCFHQGALYLNCVFPYPLHSHSQMQELVSNIISILKLAVI